jgi:putative ABC transport system permease protein
MLNDLRFALRSVARTPVFTAIVVLTLGVAIAGATAIASVASAMIFQPPPYPEPHEVMVIGRGPDAVNTSLTFATFTLLRQRVTACEHIGARTVSPGVNMLAGGKAEYVTNGFVTAGYFEALGIVPRYGRSFRVEDERRGGPSISIVDEELARRTFGSPDRAIGQTLILGSRSYEVVGVLPHSERPPVLPDVWLPLTSPGDGLNYSITCRIRNGRSSESAAAELASLQPDLAALHTGGMRGIAAQQLAMAPLHDVLTRDRRPFISMLTIAVAVVLLIACANSAWLFSARAVDRRSESAIRAALGAGRWKIVRQILIESVVLSLIGGALGIVLAVWSLPVLLSLQDQGWRAEMDVVVVGVAVFAAICAGALCGLIPALRHARLDPIESLQAGSRRLATGRDSALLRRIMVFSEVALCMMLLVTSGLLVRCLVNLGNVELGFDPRNVVTAEVSMNDARYGDNAVANAFYDRVLEQLAGAPGVESAAVVTNIPIDQGLNLPIRPPVPLRGESVVSVDWRYVSDAYFTALQVPLREGRDFLPSDRLASTPVAIVNQAFVERYFPQGGALGSPVQLAGVAGITDPRQIVGVVANTQQRGLKSLPPPTVYVPVRQVPDRLLGQVHQFFPVSWVVRTRGTTNNAAADALGAALRNADPRLPMSRVRTMDGVIAAAMGETRLQAVLLSTFGVVTVLMAVTALAGSILYAVMRRKRDIGLRLALGASVSGMLRSVVGENVVLAIAGIVAGVGAALLFRNAMNPFLFGVTATDGLTYITAGILLFCITAAASIAAAVPVLRIDPADTLRSE